MWLVYIDGLIMKSPGLENTVVTCIADTLSLMAYIFHLEGILLLSLLSVQMQFIWE